MKSYLKLLSMLVVALLAFSCGDDDNGDDTPTVPAPKFVSVTPANGTTEVSTGDVSITVSYDQNIVFLSSNTAKIIISGGTIKKAIASGKTLLLTANCPTEGATVSITIPKGLVKNTQQSEADEVSFSFTTKQPYVPVTGVIPNKPLTTNAAAVKLYEYFYAQYCKKTISSVMADVNWNNDCAEKVYKLTGKYPAMNCYDFIHILYSPANWIDYTNLKPVRDWVAAGGIVQLMWHFNVPKSVGSTDATCTPSETTFKTANVFVEGSWENKWFYEQMDKVVEVILALQKEGIAATWRPFHEAAGNYNHQPSWGAWFWWGADGPATYKRLWTTMYDYFKQKGIDNLIWIWTTQNYNGNSKEYKQDTDWYPGDAYVDIVGRDLYGCTASKNLQEFAEIQSTYPNKMIALSECGRDGNTNTEQAVMGDSWKAGAKWSHFMVWYQRGQGSTDTMCSDEWWKSTMSDENVITRDQLPSLK